MGKKWDYDVPSIEVWVECLRVLKPGGHLLAFAGTRTQHRMAVRIEDAGFEIRDMIAWVYGSGFPKSHDVSKAIDKAGGGCCMPENDRHEFALELRRKRESANISRAELASWFPQYSEVTKNWERLDGGFRVPSESDYQILVERLGISESWRIRVRAEDKRRLVSAKKNDRRGDGSVLGLGHSGKQWEATTDEARQWQGWGTAIKPSHEPITVARKPLIGTVAENVLRYGTGGLNIDGCRVDLNGDYKCRANGRPSQTGLGDKYDPQLANQHDNRGRWPANLIHDGSDEVTELFPASKGQTGDVKGSEPSKPTDKIYGQFSGRQPSEKRGDIGSAARFFYTAKADKAERGKDNTHPTVKPIDLMRYLIRLVTPPGGIVLDPFFGSGTTGIAAISECCKWIGIEREDQYVEIARKRLFHKGLF
jgi:DNA modification methylase